MTHNVRLVELVTKEVYIDVNDLIIELMLKTEKATNEHEKKVYRELTASLCSMRDRTHKTGASHG